MGKLNGYGGPATSRRKSRFGVDRLVGVDFGTAATAHLNLGSEVSVVRLRLEAWQGAPELLDDLSLISWAGHDGLV